MNIIGFKASLFDECSAHLSEVVSHFLLLWREFERFDVISYNWERPQQLFRLTGPKYLTSFIIGRIGRILCVVDYIPAWMFEICDVIGRSFDDNRIALGCGSSHYRIYNIDI